MCAHKSGLLGGTAAEELLCVRAQRVTCLLSLNNINSSICMAAVNIAYQYLWPSHC